MKTVPQGYRLGLTGGIGSGKSTVARMLAQRGAQVVDADAISRGLTATGGAAIAAITACFGADYIGPDGAMDRARMRERVFTDPDAKRLLEAIIHPLVVQETLAAADRAAGQTVVLDIPLLVESGHWRRRVDAVVVVDCDEATQIARVMARSGLEAAAVRRIIDTQSPRKQRLLAADVVICNQNLSFAALETEVAQLGQRFGL